MAPGKRSLSSTGGLGYHLGDFHDPIMQDQFTCTYPCTAIPGELDGEDSKGNQSEIEDEDKMTSDTILRDFNYKLRCMFMENNRNLKATWHDTQSMDVNEWVHCDLLIMFYYVHGPTILCSCSHYIMFMFHYPYMLFAVHVYCFK